MMCPFVLFAPQQVVIQVEDVNETPVFERETYTAEIFSIAPFGYPVVTVKVWDSLYTMPTFQHYDFELFSCDLLSQPWWV